jgi:hypothetical protein
MQPEAIPNPDLTWYHIKMYNIALDFGILKNTLSGTFELYRRDRTGLLATSSAVVPGTVGATLPQENLNADRNFGWEFSLDYRNRINKFYFSVSPQISLTRSMRTHWLESVANNQFDHWRNRTSGRYNNIWWGNESQHMFTSLEEIRNYHLPMYQGATPGDWILNDWNGDGTISATWNAGTASGEDTHPIGTTGIALYNFGINADASWKNFDFAMNWAGAYGVFIEYRAEYIQALANEVNGTLSQYMDRWRPADPNADYFSTATEWIPGYYPVTSSGWCGFPHDGMAIGTNLVQDASYIRMKTLEIGYTLPKNLLKIIKNLRVSFSGYNLLTFTGLKYTDPERPGRQGAASNFIPGSSFDQGSYPVTAIYNLGASIKF